MVDTIPIVVAMVDVKERSREQVTGVVDPWARRGEDGDRGLKMWFFSGARIPGGTQGVWGTRRKLPGRCQSCLQDTLHTH